MSQQCYSDMWKLYSRSLRSLLPLRESAHNLSVCHIWQSYIKNHYTTVVAATWWLLTPKLLTARRCCHYRGRWPSCNYFIKWLWLIQPNGLAHLDSKSSVPQRNPFLYWQHLPDRSLRGRAEEDSFSRILKMVLEPLFGFCLTQRCKFELWQVAFELFDGHCLSKLPIVF